MTSTALSLDARQFHNALRILGNIDFDDLDEAGVLVMGDGDTWIKFRENPYLWAVQADDEKFAALFSIIEARL